MASVTQESALGRAIPAGAQTRKESSRFWRRFRRHKLAVIGASILLILALLGVFAPVVAPKDPIRNDIRNRYVAPNSEFWLGTDGNGRDVWARTIYGIRVSLSVGLIAALISTAIGLLLGLLSGLYGGWVDMLIMRFTEVMMCVPTLLAILTVVALVQSPSIFNIMLIIGALGWTGNARLVRGQVLSVRELDYVLAARAVGMKERRIAFAHMLPNVLAPLIVSTTFNVAGAILAEASLSFLGLGTPPPTPSWGTMLNNARSFDLMENYLWLWLPPGLLILVTALSINFVGDGLRDALDPRMDRR
jgi:peptide/nickel transport system permease protein